LSAKVVSTSDAAQARAYIKRTILKFTIRAILAAALGERTTLPGA
jgi:hypothetical protein